MADGVPGPDSLNLHDTWLSMTAPSAQMLVRTRDTVRSTTGGAQHTESTQEKAALVLILCVRKFH